MSEMVERVARKLAARRVYGGYDAETREQLIERQMYQARRDARAAVEGMRNPTPEMLAAGWTQVHRFWGKDKLKNTPGPGFKEAFNAMIDAALMVRDA